MFPRAFYNLTTSRNKINRDVPHLYFVQFTLPQDMVAEDTIERLIVDRLDGWTIGNRACEGMTHYGISYQGMQFTHDSKVLSFVDGLVLDIRELGRTLQSNTIYLCVNPAHQVIEFYIGMLRV